MFQYTVLVWDTRNAHATAAARLFAERLAESSPHWQRSFESPGLIALHVGEMPNTWEVYPLQDGAGLIFGKLHREFGAVKALNASESRMIVTSEARHLIEHYWGRYVAFVRDPRSRATRVLRDPQGGLLCMHTLYEGVHVFLSDMNEGLPRGLLKLSIDEEQLTVHMCDLTLSAHASMYKEINLVTPGECMTVHASGKVDRELYWQPMKIARSNIIEDPDVAIREVRRVTRGCVWAWAASYERIMLNLSGGLDSAVVLSCLSSAPNKPTVVCVNHFDTSIYGDERRFARLAAERAGVQLVEVEHETSTVNLEPLRRLKKSPRPSNYLAALHSAHIRREIARKWELEALFDGSVGDPLFFNLEKRFIAFDYLFHRGFGWDFIQTAAAVARIESEWVGTLLAQAAKAYVAPHRWSVRRSQAVEWEKLLPSEVIEAAQRTKRWVHPWLRDCNGVPPGKQIQINGLTSTFEYNDAMGLYLEPKIYIPSLLSQPLVELCLRIPIFVHSPHGTPRVTERGAFAQDIPPEIVERTTKGLVDSSLEKIVENNLPFLREFMLDGWLVKNRLLDRVKLEGVLSNKNRLFSEGAAQLMYGPMNTEAWIQSAVH